MKQFKRWPITKPPFYISKTPFLRCCQNRRVIFSRMLHSLTLFNNLKKNLMRSKSPLSNLRSSWRRLMILVRHIEPVVNNQPSFTSSWTTWTRSTLCTSSLLTGIKLSSWDPLKSLENRCSKTELRASPSITLCRSTNKLADHCLRKISFYFPCKCA